MKIFIDQFCLTEGDGASPSELVIHGERQAQSVPLLRGSSPLIFSRGNRTNTLTFTVARHHPGYAAAEEFLCQHAAELPQEGVLGLEFGGVGGPIQRYRAGAAVVVSDQGSQAGLVTTHRYRIVCGELRLEG